MRNFFNNFSFYGLYTGILSYLILYIGFEVFKKIRIREGNSLQTTKKHTIAASTKKKKRLKEINKLPNLKFNNKLPRILFIIIFLQICMYSIGLFSTFNKANYTDWQTYFPKPAFSNSILSLIFTILYIVYLKTTYGFISPIFKLNEEDRQIFLTKLKKNKQFELSTKALLFTVVLRLILFSVPFFFESKFINQVSILIKEIFPYIKLLTIKIWSSLILGIIVPGVVGNFFYDIIKSYILKKYFTKESDSSMNV